MRYWLNNLWWMATGGVWMAEMMLMPRVAFAELMVRIWVFGVIIFPVFLISRGVEALGDLFNGARGASSGGGGVGRIRDPIFNHSHRGRHGHLQRTKTNGGGGHANH